MKNLLDSKTDEQLNDISNIVNSHLSEHYEEIENILKVEISQDLRKCIQGIIIKTNQKKDVEFEISKRILQTTFDNLSNKTKRKFNEENT
jgi:NCAIR mutase (PurE)-related protein|tara:strand:+ start:200 stop:469 length:270 start_codon:yes stop_codon:yes gene_type:complete